MKYLALCGLSFVLGIVFVSSVVGVAAEYKPAPDGCKSSVYSADNGDYFRIYICRKKN